MWRYTYSMNVSGMEFSGFFEEFKARMCVYNILNQWHKIFRCQMISSLIFEGEYVHKLGRFVMMRGHHFPPEIRKSHVRQQTGFVTAGSREQNGLPIKGKSTSLKRYTVDLTLIPTTSSEKSQLIRSWVHHLLVKHKLPTRRSHATFNMHTGLFVNWKLILTTNWNVSTFENYQWILKEFLWLFSLGLKAFWL